MSKLSRRDFTRKVGLAALFAPFLSLRGTARAQSATRRATHFLLFFTNGTDPGLWSPTGSTESNLRFSAMTEPLSPLKANLTLIEKLSSLGTADNHAAPGGLTGVGYSGQRHTSVDVFIADRLRASGVETSIPNLILGGVATEQQTSFFRDGQRLSPIFSPTTAYDTIFAGAAPGGDATASSLLRRRKSILDLLSGELDGLSRQLGADERRKLELHAQSIRDVERRLGGGGGGGAACAPPSEPSPAGQDLLDSALHLDLAITAMACDITRVAAVHFGNHQSTQISIPEVGAPGDWHNSFIHGDNPRTRLTNLERWLCEQFVAAATKLKALPAPDGDGTMFDRTLMVWARDMGDAVGHNGNDMRFVFSGGAGGYLRTAAGGRYLDGSGDAHQQALISCCDAMGIRDVTGFGDAGAPRTPLSSLAA